MKLSIQLPRYYKYLAICSTLFAAFYVLYWLNLLRGFDDRKIQSIIDENLANGNTIAISSLIPNANRVCILPPYSEPESIKSFLSTDQINYLDLRINSLFGTGDHVWWMVSYGGNKSIRAYRIGGLARPAFKTGKCLFGQHLLLTLKRNSGYLFFDFSKGD